MRFVLSRFGGLAAIRQPPLVVDTASLPQDESMRLHSLVQQAGLHQLPAELSSAQPDTFGYELQVTHDDGQVTSVSFDHSSAPQPLRELVSALRKVKASRTR
jgi:hypothetical protein